MHDAAARVQNAHGRRDSRDGWNAASAFVRSIRLLRDVIPGLPATGQPPAGRSGCAAPMTL